MTLDNCEALFDAIRSTNSGHELLTLFSRLFEPYKILSFTFGRGSIFWRARKNDGTPYKNKRELSYPPREVTGAYRLNDPEKPCLYAATRRETALIEINAQVGDHVQIVGYRIKPGSTLRFGTIGEFFHVYKTGYLRTLGKDPEGVVNKLINGTPIELTKLIIYIDAFLSDLLSDKEAHRNDYIKTRVLANMSFQKSGIDSLLYPSVKSYAGMNLAISASSFDAHAELVCVQQIFIEKKREFGFFDLQIMDDAVSVEGDGNIVWSGTADTRTTKIFNLSPSEIEHVSQKGGILLGSEFTDFIRVPEKLANHSVESGSIEP